LVDALEVVVELDLAEEIHEPTMVDGGVVTYDFDVLVALPQVLEHVQGDVQCLRIQHLQPLVDEEVLDAHRLPASGQSTTAPACD
jgi:hypothetical protein